MGVTDDLEEEDTQALRARRLFQIANLAIAALAAATLAYAFSTKWNTVCVMLGGIGLMLVCRWLSRRGQTDLGNPPTLFLSPVWIAATV